MSWDYDTASGRALRSRMWQQHVPPVERRHKLWILRGRLHQGTGYYSPYDRVGLPHGRKPFQSRPIHTAQSRADLRECFE